MNIGIEPLHLEAFSNLELTIDFYLLFLLGLIRWQGIVTVLLTAIADSFAYAPFTIYHMIEPLMKNNPSEPTLFHAYFLRIAWAVLCCNIIANFFVYSLSVTSFRAFLKTKLQVMMARLSYKRSPQGNKMTFQNRLKYSETLNK